MTTVCQTLTTAILSLLAASLSVASLFSLDVLALIQFILVFQALNFELGSLPLPKKKSHVCTHTHTCTMVDAEEG